MIPYLYFIIQFYVIIFNIQFILLLLLLFIIYNFIISILFILKS